MNRNEPTPHMLEQAAEYAQLVAKQYGEEACGVFFYPDRLMATGMERPCVPQFVRMLNVSDEPKDHFEFDSDQMVDRIRWAYVGLPSGFVQVFHSHVTDVGPSPDDFAMVDALADALAGHPVWAPTPFHKLYSVPSDRWIDFSATIAEDTFFVSTNQGPDVG